jgi:hypothetical protein
MTKTDSNVELAKLQNDILEHLGLSQENVVFEFVSVFHQEVGVDKVDAAHKMLDYVRSYKEKENSYTIQWMKRGDLELQTSYFRANNVYGALDKLNYGRDMNTITVYSVVLNPVS